VESWGSQNFADCQLGEAIESTGAGNWQGVGCRIWSSLIDDLQSREALKRACEFWAKAQFNKLTQPHCQKTAVEAANLVFLAVGDTTYLDYKRYY